MVLPEYINSILFMVIIYYSGNHLFTRTNFVLARVMFLWFNDCVVTVCVCVCVRCVSCCLFAGLYNLC